MIDQLNLKIDNDQTLKSFILLKYMKFKNLYSYSLFN